MGDEDKQFDATPRKLEQARKEGQVVKSKDFSTAVSLLVLFSVIFGLAPFIWKEIVQVINDGFTLKFIQTEPKFTVERGKKAAGDARIKKKIEEYSIKKKKRRCF